MSRFIFIYESDETDLIKEFTVKDGATQSEIIEAFGAFLVLCGEAYDDGSLN